MLSPKDFFRMYKWTLIGAGAGLAVAVLILSVGFWKALFVTALVAAGAAIGTIKDTKTGAAWLRSVKRWFEGR